MDLFKKGLLLVVVLCIQSACGTLNKNEQFRAMALQAHLHNLAARSKHKPLPVWMQKGVAATVKQLEQLNQKDPESHILERAKKFESTIKYESPVRIEKKEEAPSQEELFAHEKQKKQQALRNEFINHLSALQKEETWQNYRPTNAWKQQALRILKSPALLDVTFNEVNAANTLLETLVNKYMYFVYQAKAEDRVAIRKEATVFIDIMKKDIFNVYSVMVLEPGVLWDAKTMTISKQWQDSIIQFLCYVLRGNHSDQKLEELQKDVEQIVAQKYTIEGAPDSEVMNTTKNTMMDALKRCQQELIAKASEIQTPLQQAKKNFETLMSIIKSATPTGEQKQKHEDDAIQKASEWLQKVSDDELESMVDEIKTMYKEALWKQVKPWYAWAGMWTGNEETKKRRKLFDDRLDAIISQRLQSKAEVLQKSESVSTAQEGVVATAEGKPSEISTAVPVSPKPPVMEQGQPPAGPTQGVAPSTQAQKPAEQLAQGSAQLTEEQKKEKVKQYIQNLNFASTKDKGNIERSEEGEAFYGARITDAWLQGLLLVVAENGLEYSGDDVERWLQEKFQGWNDYTEGIKGSYVISQALNRISQLRKAAIKKQKVAEEKQKVAEEKQKTAEEKIEEEKKLSEYVATLSDSGNWEFVGDNQYQLTLRWEEGFFDNFFRDGERIPMAKVKEIMIDALTHKKPSEVMIGDVGQFVDKFFNNMERNKRAWEFVLTSPIETGEHGSAVSGKMFLYKR